VLRAVCAYCHSVDAFAWGVVGSVAGVVAAAAAIVGLILLLRDRRKRAEVPAVPGRDEDSAAAVGGNDVLVVVGEIPQQPVAFQPRTGLLAGLEDGEPGTRIVVVRAVTGMRGVGKTQLAAEYARARLAERWRLVAWINAEEPARVLAALSEVAGALGLGAGDGEAAGRAVRHWLETGGQRCLLVFDNATDPVVLRPFIPATGAAQVIITSNEQSMGYLGAGVPVDVFTRKEALAFLADRTGSADAVGAGMVAAELGYLPLALAQAAAVIAGQRLGYGTYLDRLRALPAGELLRAEDAGQYPRGVAAAVLLSLEGVRADDDTGAAVAVMELLAVLSPAGVRRTMIHAAGRHGVLGGDGQAGGQAAVMVDRALARLAGASLLTFSVDGSAVTAHRLVMRVIREEAAARNALAGVCAAAAGLLDELADALRETWHEDRAAVRDLVEQIMALYGASASCSNDSALTRRLIQLRWSAVWFLNSLGDSAAQSVGIAEPLLADQERVVGIDHPDTLRTRNSLANAYQAAGRTAEAIALHERTLADEERVLGSDHPETLQTRNNLAMAYEDAGRTAEAIALLERTLADRERVLGIDHPDTLATRGNLAIAYRAAGRTAEAIALHERILPVLERVLGSDHPGTLRTRNNLGNAYRDAGRTAEAIALHERTLAVRERMLGSDHPETLRTRNNLANDYRDAGRTAEAITLHEQNLPHCERVLGSDHTETLRTRNDLANAYRDAGGTAEPVDSEP
jgi:tetratricopeptide (TPR) repeat protein